MVSCSHLLISPQYEIASAAVRKLHKMWCVSRSDCSMAPWCLSLGTRLGDGFDGEDWLAARQQAAGQQRGGSVEKQQLSSRELDLLLNGTLLLCCCTFPVNELRITNPRCCSTQAHETSERKTYAELGAATCISPPSSHEEFTAADMVPNSSTIVREFRPPGDISRSQHRLS